MPELLAGRVIAIGIDFQQEICGTLFAKRCCRRSQECPMSIANVTPSNYSRVTALRSLPDLKTTNFAGRPEDADRAQRIVESVVQADAGRQGSVENFTSHLQRQQTTLTAIDAIIGRLPATVSQKERDAWNTKRSEIQQDIGETSSQISFHQSLLDNNPSRDRTLKFAAGVLGISTEEVHKLYDDRAKAVAAAKASAAAAEAAAAAAAAGSNTSQEWGSERTGLRAEIKVDGVVVGRVYNSGAVELADDYASLDLQLRFSGPGEEGLEGPNLAERRIALLMDTFRNLQAEAVKATTAMTQAQWQAAFGNARVDRSV